MQSTFHANFSRQPSRFILEFPSLRLSLPSALKKDKNEITYQQAVEISWTDKEQIQSGILNPVHYFLATYGDDSINSLATEIVQIRSRVLLCLPTLAFPTCKTDWEDWAKLNDHKTSEAPATTHHRPSTTWKSQILEILESKSSANSSSMTGI